MSEFQETLLDTAGNQAKTFAEAFGCPLEELHIVNEEGGDLPAYAKERVLSNIHSEDNSITQTSESRIVLGKVMKKTKSFFSKFFSGEGMK